jgi:DUF438 domain-containing protein
MSGLIKNQAGRQDAARFRIQILGRFAHNRYLAVRDPAGAWLGTLEGTQGLTRLRALPGDRRLLPYDPA